MSTINPQDRYRCPECGLSDRVEKATVSNRVKPPILHLGNSQAYESPWGCFSVGFVIISVVAFLFFLVIFLWYASVPGARPGDVVPELLVTLVLVGIAAILTMHHVIQANDRRKAVTQYNTALQSNNMATQKRFDQDRDTYENKLYYCGRDDVVFILGKPDTCIPASQIEYLYGT